MGPHKILEVNRFSREDEEILGGARDLFERNEARGRRFMGELKTTHLFSVVSCQGQVRAQFWERVNRYRVGFEPEEMIRSWEFPNMCMRLGRERPVFHRVEDVGK